eukprot:9536515-Heterocapsa_arctica.AAC.1
MEYSPAVPTRTVALLVGLLSPEGDSTRPFMEQLRAWGRQLLAYDLLTDDLISEAAKCEVVLKAAPQ